MTVASTAPTLTRRRVRRSSSRSRLANLALRVSGVAIIVLVWLAFSLAGKLGNSSIPTIGDVSSAFWDGLFESTFWGAVWHTLEGWAIGLGIGAGTGLLVGTLIATNIWLERSATIVVEFFKTIPVVAVLPIAVLVMGTNLKMKIVIVAFGVTWPMLIQTIYGMRSLDPIVRDTATAMGIKPIRRFFTVLLPSASPFIATGLRVAATGALILTIVVELFVGGAGLGVQISRAALTGQTALPTMYARVVTAALLGVLMSLIFTALERRLLAWHEAYRPEVVL